MATRIMTAARETGLGWRKLDKMIRPALCRTGCWRCTYGCPFGAKWSARDFVDEAIKLGAVLQTGSRVTRVVLEGGRAAGVEVLAGGRLQTIRAPLVVLSGGGIGSPRILHASDLAPRHAPFFSDPVVAVMGSVDETGGRCEPENEGAGPVRVRCVGDLRSPGASPGRRVELNSVGDVR